MRILKCNVEITTGIEVYTNAGKKKTFQTGHLGSVKQFLWAAANQIKKKLFSLSHVF